MARWNRLCKLIWGEYGADRFSYGMAASTAKKGLAFGLVFGGAQELIGYVQRKRREIEEQELAQRAIAR
jgi:hypothetical protein